MPALNFDACQKNILIKKQNRQETNENEEKLEKQPRSNAMKLSNFKSLPNRIR